MQIFKILSIISLIGGIIIFFGGIWLYWVTDPVLGWASVLVTLGLLFLLIAIIFICLGQEYDVIGM